MGEPKIKNSGIIDVVFGDNVTVPSPDRVITATYQRLALTVESVPDGFWDEHFDVWVARWP